MAYVQRTVQCLSPSGLHRMAYNEWGARDNPRVVVCVHGLTRNARDFDRLAAQPGAPIRRLVLNDVGPLITQESLKRIGEYVGSDPTWATLAEAEAYVRAISAPFGPLRDADWRFLTETSVVQRTDGRWGFRYDPAIAAPFRAACGEQDIDLWPVYQAIACPTLAIRGAESDLLTRATWQRMGEVGPRAQLAEVAGVGHAPMFMDEAQIALVRDFLLAA